MAVDDARYVDFTKMIQRRMDDPSKFRNIQRKESDAPAQDIKKSPYFNHQPNANPVPFQKKLLSPKPQTQNEWIPKKDLSPKPAITKDFQAPRSAQTAQTIHDLHKDPAAYFLIFLLLLIA
jgi:hypothetical protein